VFLVNKPGVLILRSTLKQAPEALETSNFVFQTAADTDADPLKQTILVAPSPPTQAPMPAEERDRLLSGPHSLDVATTTVDSASQIPLSELRQAELIQLPDAGHLIPLEVPDQLAQAIRQAVSI
jgi:hypothetical protein